MWHGFFSSSSTDDILIAITPLHGTLFAYLWFPHRLFCLLDCIYSVVLCGVSSSIIMMNCMLLTIFASPPFSPPAAPLALPHLPATCESCLSYIFCAPNALFSSHQATCQGDHCTLTFFVRCCTKSIQRR